MYTATAVINYGPTPEGQHPLDRLKKGVGAEIISGLGELGVRTAISRGLRVWGIDDEGVYVDAHIVDPGLNLSDHPVDAARMRSSDIGVARDIGGSFGCVDNPSLSDTVLAVDGELSVVNGPRVRAFDNKNMAYESRVYGELMVPTWLLSEVDPDSLADGAYFAKPVRGAGSKGLVRLSSPAQIATLAARLEQGSESASGYVLQPHIDTTLPFPGSIRFESDIDSSAYERFMNAPKELRIMWFYGKGEVDWFPIVKLTEEISGSRDEEVRTKRHYAFVDEDTVPHEVVESTAASLRNIAAQSGVEEMSGALDFAWSTTSGEKEPRWRVMEGNFWQPVPPTKKENARLRSGFVRMTAKQLARIATEQRSEQ